MPAYINKMYIRCDDEECDKEEYLDLELGVGGLDDSFFCTVKTQIRILNQHLEDKLQDKEGHLHGWSAIIKGKYARVYCPKHASLRILEKKSKVMPEKNMLYKNYIVGDFVYSYSKCKLWYANEIDQNGNLIGDAIETSYRKKECLHAISWAQETLNKLRWESDLPKGTTEECESEINYQKYLSEPKWSRSESTVNKEAA
tara:strand:- start:123 stop:722 length:600 start_codon:yes stop_codon:yes gene_type:complete